MRSLDEPIVSCPFNPEHKMRQNRLIWHLGKGCKEKVTCFSIHSTKLLQELYEHLYATCPYNALHIIKKEQINEHIGQCPDKVIFQQIQRCVILQKGKYRVYQTREDELINSMNKDFKINSVIEEEKSLLNQNLHYN